MTDFDRFSDTYTQQLHRAIGGLGDPMLFTEVKARLLVRIASRLVGPPAHLSILDVGCGPGLTDSLLTRSFRAITGVDVSQRMVERARVANPTARYESYDGRRLPFDANSFDLAFAICVLHHVETHDRSALIAEVARVTRPGGLVVILEHNPLNPLTRRVVSRCDFDEGVNLLRMVETRRLLESARTDVLEARYILFFPWHAQILRVIECALGWVPIGAQYMVAGRRR